LRVDAAGGVRNGGGAGDVDDSQAEGSAGRQFRRRPLSDPEAIRASLVSQVTGAVRWRESVQFMADRGVDRFVEIGAGKVLAGLVKRIATRASAVSVGTPADVEAYKAARAV